MKINKPLDISCFILNGGKSSRMKTDKAKITIKGQSFLDRIIEELAPHFIKCFLVGKEYPNPLVEHWFEDRIIGIGPMGGLYTGLVNSKTDKNFVIALDYPMVRGSLVFKMGTAVKKYLEYHDGVIPLYDDGPHPLFAFYKKSCLRAIERCIEENEYCILNLRKYCNILLIDIRKLIPPAEQKYLKTSLFNINTENDYENLLKILHCE